MQPTLKNYDEEANARVFDAIYEKLTTLVEADDPDYYLLTIRWHRRHGRPIAAMQLLLDRSTLGDWRLTDKKRFDLCNELGWSTLANLMTLQRIAFYELMLPRKGVAELPTQPSAR